jgi:hypothetical protein
MIPYSAIEKDDAEAVMPWTNIGLIVVNFLVFFYELGVWNGTTGGRPRHHHRVLRREHLPTL